MTPTGRTSHSKHWQSTGPSGDGPSGYSPSLLCPTTQRRELVPDILIEPRIKTPSEPKKKRPSFRRTRAAPKKDKSQLTSS